MKKSLLLLALFAKPFALHGQLEATMKFKYKNSFQIELAGPAIFYSLNFERILVNGNRFKTSLQAGIGYIPTIEALRDENLEVLGTSGNFHPLGGLAIGYAF